MAWRVAAGTQCSPQLCARQFHVREPSSNPASRSPIAVWMCLQGCQGCHFPVPCQGEGKCSSPQGTPHHTKVRNTNARGPTSSHTALHPRKTAVSWSHSYPKTACPHTPPEAPWPVSSSPQHCPGLPLPLPTLSRLKEPRRSPATIQVLPPQVVPAAAAQRQPCRHTAGRTAPRSTPPQLTVSGTAACLLAYCSLAGACLLQLTALLQAQP